MVPSTEQEYDYIITGAGCAGLSLIVHMIHSGKFSGKKILLIDKDNKNKNDRTWCFWEQGPGLFEEIVYRKWEQVWINSDDYSKLLSLSPYTYKLIRGIDFYNHCFKLIGKHSNIHVIKGEVQHIESNDKETFVRVNQRKINAKYIFNSILFEKPDMKKKEIYLLQHFKGWVIKTPQPVFNTKEATLMDFRISQEHGTTFVYVMPFSPTSALVEYTLFTGQMLYPNQYDEGLRNYIQRFIFKGPYKIDEEEFGIIPMTNHKYVRSQHKIINMGTAGGQTKPSSGYTFRFIQKHAVAIVDQLARTGDPFIEHENKKRFHFYDNVLLDILDRKSYPGKDIFVNLFKKNKPRRVLRFLDNESSLGSELKIISSLPTWPFLKSALRQV